MPVRSVPVTIKGKLRARNEYDLIALRELLNFSSEEVIAVYLEKVTAKNTDGVTSAFRFGYGAGCLEATFIMKYFPTHLVRPQVWKTRLDLIGTDKDASRALADRLFPTCAPYWKLKKSDGLAEAALIGYFGILALELDVQLDLIKPGDTFEKKPSIRKKKIPA